MQSAEAVAELVRMPHSLDRLGVPPPLVEDLFLRRLLVDRVSSIGELAAGLCLSHQVGMELATDLKNKNLVEYLGAAGRDYRVQLTELGHRSTSQRMTSGRHVGPIPVAHGHYERVVRLQANRPRIDRHAIRAAFHDLIVDDTLLDQIGPAFASDGAIFFYGPPGTGKTSLAERLNRLADDPVLIPRYVEVDGQIVGVFDPSLHEPLPTQPAALDPRWVLCRRPLLVVGGELDLTMLNLRHDRVSGLHDAPIQMRANNGILVLDDFGRQAIRPDEILNRWIIPLSRGVDFLRPVTGAKFTVPFELKLVISTNLDPTSLGDDAFLRRLRNKIYVGAVTEDAFIRILETVAAAAGVTLAPGAAQHLVMVARREIGELRPYLPGDVCQLTNAIADYEQGQRLLTPEMIDQVAALYFVQPDAAELRDRPIDVWRLPPIPDTRRSSRLAFQDYQIGPEAWDNPLDGLEHLASTLSVEHGGGQLAVPPALRADPPPATG